MRVKRLTKDHNTMSPAMAGTLAARSGVERTNSEATAPPSISLESGFKSKVLFCLMQLQLSSVVLQKKLEMRICQSFEVEDYI